jgi:hypothetical protein
MELNGCRPTWTQFVQLVNARFRLPLTDSPVSELAMLRRTGSVDEYSKRFIALSCHDTTLSEPQQNQLFITGLGDPLRTDVVLQQSASLDDAVIFARAYEQRNTSSQYTSWTVTLPVATTTGATPSPSTGSVNKLAPSSIRLSPSEIAQCRKDGKCFKCNELFTPDHRKHCKQLFIIEVVDKEEVDDLSPATEEPTISLHALVGIQLRASRTMALMVDVNDTRLIALLDFGSTHNFIDNAAAPWACVILAERHGLRVTVANGD